MAFPTSPSNGDQYTNANGTLYEYVAADDKWVIVQGTLSNVDNTAFSSAWNGETTKAPSQNHRCHA